MPKALRIVAFEEVDSPILEPVTKFGGQPVWLEEPTWPLHPETSLPLAFLAQVKLEPEIFGNIASQMAYIFFNDIGWETAVVLQPGRFDGLHSDAAIGPSTQRDGEPAPEFGVRLEPVEEPEYVPQKAGREWTDEEFKAYQAPLEFNKVGGTPAVFDEWHDFPDDDPEDWRLILQLYSCEVGARSLESNQVYLQVPFDVLYGDGGCGWVWLSKNGEEARMTVYG